MGLNLIFRQTSSLLGQTQRWFSVTATGRSHSESNSWKSPARTRTEGNDRTDIGGTQRGTEQKSPRDGVNLN